MYFGATSGIVKLRQELEARIVKAVITEALRLGYYLSVDDGENQMSPTRNRERVIDAIMETDDDYLHLYQQNSQHIGWIHFVYGNDGWDVISDYSSNAETKQVLIPASKIINRYS